MMRKNEKMFNKKQLIAKEIENQLLQSVLREDNDFDSIRNKAYGTLPEASYKRCENYKQILR